MRHLATTLLAIAVHFSLNMANLEGKLQGVGTATIYTKANVYYAAMISAMSKESIPTPTLHSSYASKYDIVGDLKTRLKEDFRTAAPSGVTFDGDFATLTPLLDSAKDVSAVAANPADFDNLEKYLNTCAIEAKGAFEPPLREDVDGSEGKIYQIPNSTDADPRRFARTFYFETPFTKQQLTWLINNAPFYGFVLYEDYALYYIGFAEIKTKVQGNFLGTINRFQSEAIPQSELTLSASTIASFPDPAQPSRDKTPSGTMYFSNPSNPLLVVFGGIDVNGKPSGEYMPPYFDRVFTKYNIWIADSSRVNGPKSYDEVNTYIAQKGLAPPARILYLFSGGYKPGAGLIANGKITDFNKVVLVDIWLKNDNRWPNWVKNNAAITSYFYSNSGPGGGLPAGAEQQNSILTSLNYPSPRSSDTVHFINNHMKCNEKAVATL